MWRLVSYKWKKNIMQISWVFWPYNSRLSALTTLPSTELISICSPLSTSKLFWFVIFCKQLATQKLLKTDNLWYRWGAILSGEETGQRLGCSDQDGRHSCSHALLGGVHLTNGAFLPNTVLKVDSINVLMYYHQNTECNRCNTFTTSLPACLTPNTILKDNDK